MQVSNVCNNLSFSQDRLENIETPAFIYDEVAIERLLDLGDQVRDQSSCKVLYSLKPFSFYDALEKMASRLDGFAVSSLFEARATKTTSRRVFFSIGNIGKAQKVLFCPSLANADTSSPQLSSRGRTGQILTLLPDLCLAGPLHPYL